MLSFFFFLLPFVGYHDFDMKALTCFVCFAILYLNKAGHSYQLLKCKFTLLYTTLLFISYQRTFLGVA